MLERSVKLQLSEEFPYELENDVEKAGDDCDDSILSSGLVEVQKGAEETEEEVYTTEVDDIGKVDRETFEETWENCSQDKYYEYYDYGYNELEFENRVIQDLDQGKDDLETEVVIDTKDIEGKNCTYIKCKDDCVYELLRDFPFIIVN